MSLWRKINSVLEDWSHRPRHRALLLTGARQVGKTYAVREFARGRYDAFLEVNFIEMPSARLAFEGDLDAESIIANLTALFSVRLVPGKTLIFFDEIQECPRARAAIKFLVDDGRFDYIESGSLLGVLTKEVPSLPVGYEETHRMYPLDLEEFFVALGVQRETLDLLASHFHDGTPVPDAIHQRMIRLFRLYVVTGGMPAAVSELIASSDLAEVLRIQRDILALYRSDVAKYASDKPHVHRIFDSIPAELDNENKRFVLTDLAKTARMQRYESDFMWLVDAGAALPCYNVRAPQKPLTANEKHNLFKFFMCDAGLLGASFSEPVQHELLQADMGVNWGSVLENVVAQQLAASGFGLYYYDSTKIGEVDFVVQHEGAVLPLEAKSGNDYKRHKALDNLMAVGEWGIEKAYVLCNGNVEQEGRVRYIPWYLLMFIKQKEQTHLRVAW